MTEFSLPAVFPRRATRQLSAARCNLFTSGIRYSGIRVSGPLACGHARLGPTTRARARAPPRPRAPARASVESRIRASARSKIEFCQHSNSSKIQNTAVYRMQITFARAAGAAARAAAAGAR